MRLKIGIIGLANIAKKYIIRYINELESKYELVVIASRNQKNKYLIENEYKANFVSNYDDIFNFDLDAIYIPLPNSLHFYWVEYALKKKINVLVEKPLCMNYQESIYLNSLSKKNNVLLLENFQFRFHSQLKFITDLINNNKIGEIKKMNSTFCFSLSDYKNIRFNKKLGGGSLYDTGVYPLRISQIILGKNLDVEYSNRKINQKYNVDISGNAILKDHDKDVSSFISYGFENFYECSLEIFGDRGKIFTNRIFTCPPNVKPEIFLKSKDSNEKFILDQDNHFINILNYFYESIIHKKNHKIEIENNLNQSKLLQKLFDKI